MGGAAGALGALGIIMAFNFGGKPVYVMPLIFGGAPVVNTFFTITAERLVGSSERSVRRRPAVGDRRRGDGAGVRPQGKSSAETGADSDGVSWDERGYVSSV